MASLNWGFETIVFYGVGLLTLSPTLSLEDQDFILSGFTPLGMHFLWLLCCGLGDPAGSYTTAGIARSFLEACNPPCPALRREVPLCMLLNAVFFFFQRQ
jgi:hypothetical protein